MTTAIHSPRKVASIMQSYEGLPIWVKIWMNFILGPVNLATLAFLNEPSGMLIAALAIGGMAMTVSIVIASGGFSKLAAAGHILPWTPLVYMLAFVKPEGSDIYQMFLTVLLVTNVISLVFDFNDVRLWVKSKIDN